MLRTYLRYTSTTRGVDIKSIHSRGDLAGSFACFKQSHHTRRRKSINIICKVAAAAPLTDHSWHSDSKKQLLLGTTSLPMARRTDKKQYSISVQDRNTW